MYLHIEFADGSNPYVKYGEFPALWNDLSKWQRNYNCEIQSGENINVKAYERTAPRW